MGAQVARCIDSQPLAWRLWRTPPVAVDGHAQLEALRDEFHLVDSDLQTMLAFYCYGTRVADQQQPIARHLMATLFDGRPHAADDDESLFFTHLLSLARPDAPPEFTFSEFCDLVCTFCSFTEAQVVAFAFDTFDPHQLGFVPASELRRLSEEVESAADVPGYVHKALQAIIELLEVEAGIKEGDDFDPLDLVRSKRSRRSLGLRHTQRSGSSHKLTKSSTRFLLGRKFKWLGPSERPGVLTRDQFAALHLKHPQMLWPLFRMQDNMRRQTLGAQAWISIAVKIATRQRQHERETRRATRRRRHVGEAPIGENGGLPKEDELQEERRKQRRKRRSKRKSKKSRKSGRASRGGPAAKYAVAEEDDDDEENEAKQSEAVTVLSPVGVVRRPLPIHHSELDPPELSVGGEPDEAPHPYSVSRGSSSPESSHRRHVRQHSSHSSHGSHRRKQSMDSAFMYRHKERRPSIDSTATAITLARQPSARAKQAAAAAAAASSEIV